MQQDLSGFAKFVIKFILVLFVISIVVNIVSIPIGIKHRKETREAIDAGYECYYDGELVDGTKLVLNNYIAEINHEDKVVLLTKRVYYPRRHSYIPVYVPGIHY